MTTVEGASLHPLTTINPETSLNEAIRWEKNWKITYYAANVFFTAITAYLIHTVNELRKNLFSSRFSLIYQGMPILSIEYNIRYWLLPRLWENVEFYQKERTFNNIIQGKVESMSSRNINEELNSLELSTASEDLGEYAQKMLFAHYEYYQEKTNQLKAKFEESFEVDGDTIYAKDIKLDELNQSDQSQKIKKALLNHLVYQDQAASYYRKATYFLFLIQNPHTQKSPIEDKTIDLINYSDSRRSQEPRIWGDLERSILKTSIADAVESYYPLDFLI